MNSFDIEKDFSARVKSTPLFFYPEATSTNALAKQYAKECRNRTDTAFIAARQTEGRGRLGRSFSSLAGGLYLSYLTYPDLAPEDTMRLTVYAAVSLCEVLEEMTGVSPKIKWVNDVYLNGRKVAGILTEGEFSPAENKFLYAVVGIGVNLHRRAYSPELAEIATDLESVCGIRVSIGDFAARLVEKLARFGTSDPNQYIEYYRNRCFIFEKTVKITFTDGRSFTATAKDIDNQGALIIEKENGSIERLFTGEVSVKPV